MLDANKKIYDKYYVSNSKIHREIHRNFIYKLKKSKLNNDKNKNIN